jgi:hypothetical protein
LDRKRPLPQSSPGTLNCPAVRIREDFPPDLSYLRSDLSYLNPSSPIQQVDGPDDTEPPPQPVAQGGDWLQGPAAAMMAAPMAADPELRPASPPPPPSPPTPSPAGCAVRPAVLLPYGLTELGRLSEQKKDAMAGDTSARRLWQPPRGGPYCPVRCAIWMLRTSVCGIYPGCNHQQRICKRPRKNYETQ